MNHNASDCMIIAALSHINLSISYELSIDSEELLGSITC
jgi:hypothetical protein